MCVEVLKEFAAEMNGLLQVEFVSDVSVRVTRAGAKKLSALPPDEAVRALSGKNSAGQDYSVFLDIQFDPIEVRGLESVVHVPMRPDDLREFLLGLMKNEYFVYFVDMDIEKLILEKMGKLQGGKVQGN